MTTADHPPMNLSAAAKLLGVTPQAVSKAARTGRLGGAVRYINGKPYVTNLELVRARMRGRHPQWPAAQPASPRAPAASGVAPDRERVMSPLELRIFLTEWIATNLAIEILGGAEDPRAAAEALCDRMAAAVNDPDDEDPIPAQGVADTRLFVRAFLNTHVPFLADDTEAPE